MFKAIKAFFKSVFGSTPNPTIPNSVAIDPIEAIREKYPANVEQSQEWHEANTQGNTIFYWDGVVEKSPIESEVVAKKKRRPYKKRNNNQPKQVDQLGLPKMKANDETPRPKPNKRRGRRPNNAQKGNSASSNPQKG